MGPILLSLLSVFYSLHNDFMGTSGSGGGGSGPRAAESSRPGALSHRLWSMTPSNPGDASEEAAVAEGMDGPRRPLRVSICTARSLGDATSQGGSPFTEPQPSASLDQQSVSLATQPRRRRSSVAGDEEEEEEEEGEDATQSAGGGVGSCGSFSFLRDWGLEGHEHDD